MDYQKLADLLYPNVKYTIEELEKKYPKRNLAKGAYVTRFAPSPTGYLHIGNFFGAFLDWQIARWTGGKFFFRLEDTDKKREISGSGHVAIEILNSYGINFDEGVMPNGQQKGDYGPYVQSERLEIYKTYAKELVKNNRAFPCFCEKTESLQQVKQNRKNQLENNNDIDDHDACRNLSYEEIEKNIKEGKPFALRLRSQGKKDQKILAEDVIRKQRYLPQNTKDVVLMKNDGIPPYAFAHAVDDHLMRTGLVVRGEEWFTSYPAHIEIFEALNFEKISYLHTPVICKIDNETKNKRKLSKRKDPEADMRYFLTNGYPKVAVLEYLLTLANSNFEMWRLANPNASFLDFKFSIDKIGNSNPMFDLVKLGDISKNYIAKLNASEVYENLCEFSKENDKKFYEFLKSKEQYCQKVLSIDRNLSKPRKDFATWADFKKVFDYMFNLKKFENLSDYEIGEINKENIYDVLNDYEKIYNENDSKEEWFEKIKNMSLLLGFATDNKKYKENPKNFKGNVADVCNYIRIALTGKQNSPDIHTISQIMGNDEVKKRISTLKGIINDTKLCNKKWI